MTEGQDNIALIHALLRVLETPNIDQELIDSTLGKLKEIVKNI